MGWDTLSTKVVRTSGTLIACLNANTLLCVRATVTSSDCTFRKQSPLIVPILVCCYCLRNPHTTAAGDLCGLQLAIYLDPVPFSCLFQARSSGVYPMGLPGTFTHTPDHCSIHDDLETYRWSRK